MTVTPFGNRDFERTSLPDTDPDMTETRAWEHELELSRLLDRPAAPEVTRETRRVLLRMHGGEDVELGRVEGREQAVQMAREMVQAIEHAESQGEWPLVDDRFLRPGAIVSVDVQRANVT
jgi:hypothetical protein